MAKSTYGGGIIARFAAIGAGAALVLLLVLVVLAIAFGVTIVYILLIVTGVTSLIAFALLGYAAMQVVGLVQEVRGEVRTLAGTAQETMAEVRGTAQFLSDNVVTPVSQVAGFLSATRATLRSFTEPLYRRRS